MCLLHSPVSASSTAALTPLLCLPCLSQHPQERTHSGIKQNHEGTNCPKSCHKCGLDKLSSVPSLPFRKAVISLQWLIFVFAGIELDISASFWTLINPIDIAQGAQEWFKQEEGGTIREPKLHCQWIAHTQLPWEASPQLPPAAKSCQQWNVTNRPSKGAFCTGVRRCNRYFILLLESTTRNFELLTFACNKRA